MSQKEMSPHYERRLAKQAKDLAAKDAEIAELRSKLAECQCDRMGAETVECAQIVGEALAGPASLHIGHLPDMCRDLVASRDEARECVGRLYPALRLAMNRIGHSVDCDRISTPTDEWDHTPPKPCSCHVAKIGAAIAATPEHLR